MLVLLTALVAVAVNCYPVIFCGRSFVSPVQGGMAMVYDRWPPLPGMSPAETMQPAHGSDVAATLIWGVPAGFIESRALLEHGELPLWNRYSHAGDTLIGQAVSMLGDPLQWIVIAGRGSAWAWDIKFLVAKFLFSAGFGFLILRLSGNRGLSWISAALAAYSGPFFYINNHPAFFVFAYAPWILLSAIGMLDVRSPRPIRWSLVWLLVNVGCFNAGDVEAAVVLITGLNAAALAFALSRSGRAGWTRTIGWMAVHTVLFLGLTAPFWMSFLGTLEGSFSMHQDVHVDQLRLFALGGVFDDLFYVILCDPRAFGIAPGTSLLIMAGCVLSWLRWRRFRDDRFFWINSVVIAFCVMCIFGLVPAAVLARVPLLNRVGHLHTDFSYLLAVHLMIQAMYGFKSLVEVRDFRRAAIDCLWVALVFAGIVSLYSFELVDRTVVVPWLYFAAVTAAAFGAPLLFAYLNRGGRRISVAGWAGIVALGFIPHFRFAFYSSGDGRLLMLPGARPQLDAPSAAIDRIKADRTGPFRTVALRWQLYGDYSAVYGLEDIRSCAPLSSSGYFDLLRGFPGMGVSGALVEVADPARAQPLLDLLNVKYLLAYRGFELSPSNSLRVTDRLDFEVVENPDAWPRAFFVDKIVVLPSDADFMRYLLEHPGRPFISVSPEEMETHRELRPLASADPANFSAASGYRLLPNATAFDVHAPAAGVVCLTEGLAKGFIVRVNGEVRPVLAVNRAFKGVYLDKPGDYHLDFIYRPMHWRLACAMFWTALAVLAGLVIREFWRRPGLTKTGVAPDNEGNHADGR